MTDRRNSLALSLLGGRYRLGEVVGRGGMADVYAAVDEQTGARVAVKVFRDPLVPGAEGQVRNGDVSALEGLRHPGLVELLDVGEEQGRPFCVMTLVGGPTLAERLAQGPLAQEAVARIGSDLAAALAYVHDRGVVHRDVKPANVLLGTDGRARLADFGIARLVDATRVTRTGFTIGTAGYLAPEQVNGDRITPAADLYALGLVLLECLSGRREYDGPVIEAALARLHRRPQVPDHLPSGWRSFLQALTADDPEHRPSAAIAASAAGVLADQPGAPAEALRLDRLVREPGPRVVVPNEPLAAPAPADAPGDGAGPPVGQRAPSPDAPSTAAPARSRRTVVLATSACALVLAASAALLTRGPDAGPAASAGAGTPPASSGPASPEPVPGASSSAAAVPPQQALAELTSEVEAAVEAAPPGGAGFAPDLLERLVDLAALEGPPQANTAIALADDVGQAVDAGRYDAALGERARTVLDRVAAPEDLVALVRLARYDVQALGTDGAALERRLTALDHQTATEDVPATARQLLQALEQGQASGRVGPAFGRAAAPVLEPLARPEPLDALRRAVARLGADPQSSGEVGGEVLERMERLLDENVYDRTLGARALLRDVHDAADRGDLSASFRDEAVQVLAPLAQRGPGRAR